MNSITNIFIKIIKRRLLISAICIFLLAFCQLSASLLASVKKEAKAIIEASGIKGGFIVHLNSGDGKLCAALAVNDKYLVQGIDPSSKNVQKTHAYILAQGLASNVSVKQWEKKFLPYVDNMVNLLVSENPGAVPIKEIMRVLVPNGVYYIKHKGRWQKKVKPWPEEIDQWSHWLHGPDSNPVAKDKRSGPPRHVQWAATPKWSKSHDLGISLTGMVTAKGKLFYIADDGPVGIWHTENKLEKWALFARDAFNGLLLWKKPIHDWGMRAWSYKFTPSTFGHGPFSINPRMIHRRLVAVGNKVFLTLGFKAPISVLDSLTGDLIKELPDTDFASEIIVDKENVYAVVDRAAKKAGHYTESPRLSIIAMNYSSGKKLWEAKGFIHIKDKRTRGFDATLTRLHLTSGGGKIFLLEDKEIIALDNSTGKEVWRKSRPPKVSRRENKDTHVLNDPCDFGSILYSDKILYFWQGHHPPNRTSIYKIDLQALSSENGDLLWKKQCGGATFIGTLPLIYKAQGCIWVQDVGETDYMRRGKQSSRKLPVHKLLGLDPKNGKVLRQFDVSQIFNTHHHHRCYPPKATENYLIYSRNGLEYVNLKTGELEINRWVRGMCQYGIMPANGLLYSPADPCSCFPSASYYGHYAYSGENKHAGKHIIHANNRLTEGPAYGKKTEPGSLNTADWSIYRHDPQRSGATSIKIPVKLKSLWTTSFSEPITAPTIAQGKAFIALKQSYQVCALNSNDGKKLWSFYAENLVDTPPTMHGGKVYFGTADGKVYCLRATDGRMIWRFNANPEYRHIVSFGNIESAWPVHGSVIVKHGMVYFSAGRSSYLDGGIYFYALNSQTGKVVKSFLYESKGQDDADQISKEGDPTRKIGKVTGTANDILLHDGKHLYLKNIAINDSTFMIEKKERWGGYVANKRFPGSPLSAIGGLLDDSLFDRVGWVLDYELIAKMIVYNNTAAFYMGWWKQQKNTGHKLSFKVGENEYAIHAIKRKKRSTSTFSKNLATPINTWSTKIPIRVNSMVLTANALFCAGAPYSTDPDELVKAIDGKKGGRMCAIDPSNGNQLAEIKLQAPPVWDGLAAANGQLYVSLKNGQLICFGKK